MLDAELSSAQRGHPGHSPVIAWAHFPSHPLPLSRRCNTPPTRRTSIVGPKRAPLPSGKIFLAPGPSCFPAPATAGTPHFVSGVRRHLAVALVTSWGPHSSLSPFGCGTRQYGASKSCTNPTISPLTLSAPANGIPVPIAACAFHATDPPVFFRVPTLLHPPSPTPVRFDERVSVVPYPIRRCWP